MVKPLYSISPHTLLNLLVGNQILARVWRPDYSKRVRMMFLVPLYGEGNEYPPPATLELHTHQSAKVIYLNDLGSASPSHQRP